MINVRIQTPEVNQLSPKIAVLGVGGAGGNAVNNMIQSNLEGCEFIVCNTDSQALEGSLADKKIQLGTHVTGGLGAGANPEVGKAAAEESMDEVLSYLEGANMAFITAGMGGGTGTGAAPVIAKAARDAGVLTVGVVTKPFHFEGTHRMKMAEAGIHEMQDYVDTLIVIPNQNLFRVANEKTTFAEAFKMADSVLQSGVRGVTDLMVNPGIINLDFADIRSAMMEMGKAMMGTGEATGDRRAIEAAEAAINNPLLDDVTMKGARGVIINVTGGADISLFEVDEACNRIRDEVDPNANIIFGTSLDESMDGVMRVSVVATGIDAAEAKKTKPSGVKVTSMVRKQPAEIPEKPAASAPITSSPISRAVPNTAPATPIRSVIPTQPTVSPAVQQVTNAVRAATATAAKIEEPEADMFEQHDLVEQPRQAQQAAAPSRGTIQHGQFIPPAPVVPERQTPVSYAGGYGPQMGGQAPVQQRQAESGLVLRPPVPGQGAAERKQTPSLFERITGVRKDIMGERKEEREEQAAQPASSTGYSSGLRASHPVSDSPSQGSLNIDSPSAPKKAEDELDIPAFLRRQAN